MTIHFLRPRTYWRKIHCVAYILKDWELKQSDMKKIIIAPRCITP